MYAEIRAYITLTEGIYLLKWTLTITTIIALLILYSFLEGYFLSSENITVYFVAIFLLCLYLISMSYLMQ